MLKINEAFIIINLLLSFAILGGILNIIGALFATERTFKHGRKFSLPLLPVLHALTIGNAYFLAFGSDVEITGTMIAGVIMILEGIGIYILGMQEDFMYDSDLFSWDNDEEFFNVIGTLGISGLFSSLVGLILIFNDDSNWIIVTLCMTLLLTLVGVQGFQEKYDARWRRAIGGFGSIISGIIFAASVNDDLFRAVAFIFVGLLAFGYAALWTQRTGSEKAILDDPFAMMQPVQMNQDMPNMPALVSPGAATSAMDSIDELKEEISDSVEGVVNAVEEHVASSEAIEEVEKVLDEVSKNHDEIRDVKEQVEEKIQAAKEQVQQNNVALNMPNSYNFVDTNLGFAVNIPPNILQNIGMAIANTPHEGFKPVIGFKPNGEFILTFEPINP